MKTFNDKLNDCCAAMKACREYVQVIGEIRRETNTICVCLSRCKNKDRDSGYDGDSSCLREYYKWRRFKAHDVNTQECPTLCEHCKKADEAVQRRKMLRQKFGRVKARISRIGKN